MGLGGSGWMKKLLREDARFQHALHHASYSPARRHEIAPNARGNRVGRGVERGFDVVMVELMLRKHGLVAESQHLTAFAENWRKLAAKELLRFPDAETVIFLFDDETNVPQAKGETQRKRRKSGSGGFTAEEQILLGPYKYLCNSNRPEFDRRVNALFSAEAARRKDAGRASASAFQIFMAKHMMTRGLREDEFEFATRCIVSGAYGKLAEGNRRVIVDRGVWRDSFERSADTDPFGGGEEDWGHVIQSFANAEDRKPMDCALHLRAIEDLSIEWDAIAPEDPHTDQETPGIVDMRYALAKRHIFIAEEARKVVAAYTEGFERHWWEELQAIARGYEDARACAYRRDTTAQSGPAAIAVDAVSQRIETTNAVCWACNAVKLCDELVRKCATKLELTQSARADVESDGARRAWMLIDRWGVRELKWMEGRHLVGEADLKIPRYARLFAGRNVYAVCHDTDVLPILLMTAKDWVPREGPFRGKLWLDMTTPSDVKPKASARRAKSAPALGAASRPRPARPPPKRGVVDILRLWTDLHRWFAEDFPEVSNPVEVFCLMLVMMGTDYLKNPHALGTTKSGRPVPGLGPVKLWKAFKERRLCNELRQTIHTDGHMGAALPTDDQVRSWQRGPPPLDQSPDSATHHAMLLLLRDTTAGAFYRPDQSKLGPKGCPSGHQARHISVHEPSLIQFLMLAYKEVGPKDPSQWPPRRWFHAQARRLGWQMAYWYGGDTEEGRALEDEMHALQDDGGGASVHGWRWVRDSDSAAKVDPRRRHHHRKRKAGCLGRRKPPGMISEPAPAVLSATDFVVHQRGQRTKFLEIRAKRHRGGGGGGGSAARRVRRTGGLKLTLAV